MEYLNKMRINSFRITRVLFLFVLINLVLQANLAWSFISQFGTIEHELITKEAISPEVSGSLEAVLSNGSMISFNKSAVKEIVLSNNASDTDFLLTDKKRHFDNDTLVFGSLFLIELKGKVISEITKAEPDGQLARELLGHALHALQDYYSHTNWLNLHGSTEINDDLGRRKHEIRPQGPTCTEDLNGDLTVLAGDGLTSITSGYFEGPLTCAPVSVLGQKKCLHGSLVPFLCDGLNKDHPGRTGYLGAFNLAVLATKDYVQQILDAVVGNDDAIRVLLDQPTLKFKVFLTGTKAVSEKPEDATPLGPIEITPGNIGPKPYFGLYAAGADPAIAGTPGKDDFTGVLTVSTLNGNVDPESDPLQETTPGNILFSLTNERSGTLSYDSKKREWVIVFSPELDTSMVESLNTTIMLALSVRSGESCEGTNCTSIDRKLGIPITQELSLGKTHTITFDVSNVAFETFTFEKEDPCPGDTFFSTEFGFCRCPFGQGLALGTDDTCVPCPGLIDGNGFCLTI
jgi:hypothetical protein